ncbi:MAG: FHA domain-containing serine/threonine-protein kinase [Nostocales cyanobacterium LE14-WE4]|jgi:serine/threonine protein kinase|nr:FHA domain-containing serine/threonine-protein kinase [Anabaena sp. 49633_E8]MCE2703655.1 FHA domain-containing serine/threonine-protein kinase [Anabaena sp. 49633_E8]MDJ0501346.1 FHA domain-containing serine/threonine-protein kinase [Nostocales cyanobacterium LE14-WE4]
MAGKTLSIMVGGRIPVNTGIVVEVELQELLGSGGFGSAWKVTDCATGTPYVLKIIQGIKPGSVDAERVRLEASVSVPSEYIVPVVGLCEWDPSTFLILFEYFHSQSLDKWLEVGTLTNDQKKAVFKQILTGVADAHRCNIIHRDLKPANILVSDDSKVKLIDFGISKFKGKGVTISGAIFGTPAYMSPELLLLGSKVADARADIYALGHIFYEIAMGKHFWTHKGWAELGDLVGYLAATPTPTEGIELSDFYCGFYENATNVLRQMVKIEPNERYFSVDDIMTDLGYIPNLPEPPKDLNLRYPLLIVESGSNRGARTLVNIENTGSLVLGREDLAGADGSISRRQGKGANGHLEFSRSGDRYFVRDLGSKNGIMVRGIALDAEVPPMEIRHADRIKVGDIFLRFAFLRAG